MDFPYLCHHNGILATDMKRKIYKAHILYTKEKDRFEVFVLVSFVSFDV